MLLEFETTNYKSFLEKSLIDLKSAPKQKGLDYSILKENIKSKKIKGLSTSVIYGANASGKTNIIGAMDTFKTIILRGNIDNGDINQGVNQGAYLLELIPNKELKQSQPVEFHIKFFEKDILVEYNLKLDLGQFLDINYNNRKILLEDLYINDNLVFNRGNDLNINTSKVKPWLLDKFNNNIIPVLQSGLNPKELFLTGGFKTVVSPKLVDLILNWIKNKFIVIYRADQIIRIPQNIQKEMVYAEGYLNEVASIFGINSNGLGYIKNEEDNSVRLYSMLDYSIDGKNQDVALLSDMFESFGTIRFINIFPLLLNAIMTGGTLIVDEFDASIHPMALINIVNIFHNDDINKNHAQLIFNTHNPIFLNKNIFRRDEIKFVERDDETHCSTIYSLADFGTGKNGVRKNEDYMNNYFVNRYGAIKDIDFSDVFSNIMEQGGL